MNAKVQEKEMAVKLRRDGYSYNDILGVVSVAKSTLSNWLKDLPLTENEKKYLRKRTDANISRGRVKAASALMERRIARERVLLEEARNEFNIFQASHIFHTGVALYWAEGTKRGSSSFSFTNSDPEMIIIMLLWVEKFFRIDRGIIKARLYIHKPYANERCEEYWSKKTGMPLENFQKTIYKPTKLLVKKRPSYKGCLRITIGKVCYLKKILFWKNMLIENYRQQ